MKPKKDLNKSEHSKIEEKKGDILAYRKGSSRGSSSRRSSSSSRRGNYRRGSIWERISRW